MRSAESLVRNPSVEVWARMSSMVEGEIRTTGRVNVLETRGLHIELNRYLCPPGPGLSAYERLSALFAGALPFFRSSVAENAVRYFIVSNSTLLIETYAPVRESPARIGRFRIPNAADERMLTMILTSFGSEAVFAAASPDEQAKLVQIGLLLKEDEIQQTARSEPGSDPWLPASPRTTR
jgi:hypothetical protein